MENNKILICGLGKMGKIHAKYLSKHDIEWYWSDPFFEGPNDNRFLGEIESLDDEGFTHVIIVTPEGTHYDLYKKIRSGFSGKILIEKPVVLSKENIDVFDDEDVYCGMVERFNPTIQALKDKIDVDKIVNIDFTRCSAAPFVSRVNIFEDIGIHDLDLYVFLIPYNKQNLKFSLNNYSKTYCLTINKPISRFIWSKETYFKERKIIVRQTDCTYEADLQEQTLRKYYLDNNGRNIVEHIYVEKSSPIENELLNFLKNGISVNARDSHNLMFEILNAYNSEG